MSLRLSKHLESVGPNFELEGNTAGNPEKVDALGGLAREGGGNVRTICEVSTVKFQMRKTQMTTIRP